MRVSLAEFKGGLDAVAVLWTNRSRTWKGTEGCPLSPMADLLRKCKRDVYGVLYGKPHDCTDVEARTVKAIVDSKIKKAKGLEDAKVSRKDSK